MNNLEELTRILGKMFSPHFAENVDASHGAGYQMWHLGNTVNVDLYGDLDPAKTDLLTATITGLYRNIINDNSICINIYKTRTDAEGQMVKEMGKWEANH